jgi:hypothetical protein
MKDLSFAAIDLITGRAISPEIAKERLDTCYGCDKFDGKRCSMCGCFMHKKVGLPSSHCPLHKWAR